ncbi:MAG: GNAT family N-acetyltransferase [Bacteroidota bacterium]
MKRISSYYLRPIHEADAEAYLDLLRSIESDSPYALLEDGERQTTIAEQRSEIQTVLAQSNQMIWVVEDRDRLVAWLGAWGERYRRVSHSALVGVGVRATHRRQGLASELFQALERWAPSVGVRRLELTVAVPNQAAWRLYQKLGFRIEGTKSKSYRIDNILVDEYFMAKEVES